MLCLVAQSCLTACDPMNCRLPGTSVHGDATDKSTGVGCHALLQGILPAQEVNSHLFKSPALADRFFTTNTTGEAPINGINALLKEGF